MGREGKSFLTDFRIIKSIHVLRTVRRIVVDRVQSRNASKGCAVTEFK